MSSGDQPIHRKAKDFRWEDVEVLPYKEDARALFKSVTRQVLFSDPAQQSELRYFEVAPGGFSTLERHEHTHNVLILRGSGECLVGREVRRLATNDLVAVPPMTWHQCRSASCAWSIRRGTSHSCRRRRMWPSSSATPRSRRFFATNPYR
jgi:quercetin dioxygenase-like cupin family protein